MSTTESTEPKPLGFGSSAELGPLPPYLYGSECGPLERVWTERDMREYALAAVAAERERAEKLRGLLCEAINMGENWPGIAYTADLKHRCKNALPGWEPDYGW